MRKTHKIWQLIKAGTPCSPSTQQVWECWKCFVFSQSASSFSRVPLCSASIKFVVIRLWFHISNHCVANIWVTSTKDLQHGASGGRTSADMFYSFLHGSRNLGKVFIFNNICCRFSKTIWCWQPIRIVSKRQF